MNNVNDDRIVPGCRVLVYDYRLFINDKDTPCKDLMLPATVISRYGKLAEYYHQSDSTLGPYPDLVDVKFDHRSEISKGHFTSYIEVLA